MNGNDLEILLKDLPPRIGELVVCLKQGSKYVELKGLRVIWVDRDGKECELPIDSETIIALEAD